MARIAINMSIARGHSRPKRLAVDGEFLTQNTAASGGKTEDSKNSTANFISGMYKSVPPLQEMFNMAGMQLPEYLKGKDVGSETSKSETDKSDTPEKEG